MFRGNLERAEGPSRSGRITSQPRAVVGGEPFSPVAASVRVQGTWALASSALVPPELDASACAP